MQLPSRAPRTNAESDGDERTCRAGWPLPSVLPPPTASEGDSLRKLGRTVVGRCQTLLEVHQNRHTRTPYSIRTHTHTHRRMHTSIRRLFFHGPLHFTWSCDTPMISILSFWVVIGLSSLETHSHVREGGREEGEGGRRTAGGRGMTENISRGKRRRTRKGEKRPMKRKKMTGAQRQREGGIVSLFVSFRFCHNEEMYSNASLFLSSLLVKRWMISVIFIFFLHLPFYHSATELA